MKTLTPNQQRWILTATIIASGMAFLEGTAVNLAIPVIQNKFGANIVQIQWLVNSFALTLAAFLLISGGLGDKFGRKKVFLSGIGLFTLASVACGLATKMDILLIARAIQGLGAAAMIPGSLAIINVLFPSQTRGRAIGLWSGFSGGVAALGPFLGGWLVQTFGWPSVFFVNLPIGIFAFLLAYKFIPETSNPEIKNLDWLGTIFITLGLATLAFGLIQEPLWGWHNPLILSSIITGVILLIIFGFVENKISNPLVPLDIFKSNLVLGANLVTLFLYFALNGLIFFLVLNLQQVQGLSPLQAGLGLLPAILIITFFSGPAGSLADRIGPRLQMITAPLIVAAGMGLLIIPGFGVNYFVFFLPGLILFGSGMALIIAPLTKSALAVEEKYSGAASGVNNAVARVAALLAVAILGAVAFSIFSTTLKSNITSSSLTALQQTNILNQSDKLAGITIPDNFDQNAKILARDIIDKSFVKSFRIVIGINTGLALVSALFAFFTIKPKTS